MDWFVYIVQCKDGTFYTGITNDLSRRLSEHNNSNTVSAKYLRYRRPIVLVYSEKAQNRSVALKREAEIKRLNREKKELLIRAASSTG